MMQLIKNLSEPKNLIVVCVLYTAIITIFFLVPLSSGISTDLPIDKLVHIILNGALIFLWLFYFFRRRMRKSSLGQMVVLILAVLYGIIIEIFQELFTTARMADVWDVVANIIGCILGLIAFKFFKIKFSS